MSNNPYQPPAASEPLRDRRSPKRGSALWAFRTGLLILLPPTLFNYYAFDSRSSSNGFPLDIRALYYAFSIGSLCLGAAAAWFLTLPLLEWVAWMIRSLVAGKVPASRWDDALYESLRPAAYLALPGAGLWVVWVVGFYYLALDFVILSYAVGIPAHLLAACLYIPLIIRWFRLARGKG